EKQGQRGEIRSWSVGSTLGPASDPVAKISISHVVEVFELVVPAVLESAGDFGEWLEQQARLARVFGVEKRRRLKLSHGAQRRDVAVTGGDPVWARDVFGFEVAGEAASTVNVDPLSKERLEGDVFAPPRIIRLGWDARIAGRLDVADLLERRAD